MKLDVLKWFDSFVKDEAFSESWSPVQKGYMIQSTYCTQTMLNLSINLVGEEKGIATNHTLWLDHAYWQYVNKAKS